MSLFKKLCTKPEKPGFIPLFFSKKVPDTILYFHKEMMSSIVSLDYYHIDLATTDIDTLLLKCSITFLGKSVVYAIKDADISPLYRKKVQEFLTGYTGPHIIYFFTSDTYYEKSGTVCSASVSYDDMSFLVAHNSRYLIAPSFIKQLYINRSSYTLDESTIIMRYAHLIGSRHELFFSDWLGRLIADDNSLFTLSQYFFSQKREALSAEWIRLNKSYPHEFWIAFFSEQLWQAAVYISYVNAGKSAEAKRYTYRLPFSFFQKDYKRYTLEHIARAHTKLYEIDYQLKQTTASYGIDLFIQTAFIP